MDNYTQPYFNSSQPTITEIAISNTMDTALNVAQVAAPLALTLLQGKVMSYLQEPSGQCETVIQHIMSRTPYEISKSIGGQLYKRVKELPSHKLHEKTIEGRYSFNFKQDTQIEDTMWTATTSYTLTDQAKQDLTNNMGLGRRSELITGESPPYADRINLQHLRVCQVVETGAIGVQSNSEHGVFKDKTNQEVRAQTCHWTVEYVAGRIANLLSLDCTLQYL